MEGTGSYNRYAKLPAGGAALAMPLLEKAVQELDLGPAEQPMVIADYGSSQGKNSMIPMQAAIRGLRNRVGAKRAIAVFHVDQPSNDFNALFEVLDSDPDRYTVEANVFVAAIGKSFYESVLPPGSVHLAWSSYAAVWVSQIPTVIPGHFIALRSTGSVRAEFERQATKDWQTFLELRARELRPGGRLVIVLPAVADDGVSGFENIFDEANATLEGMVADGAIKPEERARMVLGSYPRRKNELLAPFVSDGHFQQMMVQDLEVSPLLDPAWVQYQLDEDREALATKQALFFRAVFMPSLASALDDVRSGDSLALRNFGDQLEIGLKRRLASKPAAMHSFVQVMLLAKALHR